MVIHFFPVEKFTSDYIDKIYELFDAKEHIFVLYGESDDLFGVKRVVGFETVYYCKRIRDIKKKVLSLVKRANKIIFHSLSFSGLDLLFITRVVLLYREKTAWVIWGADLYNEFEKNNSKSVIFNPKIRIRELLRKTLIKRIRIFVTSSDFDELKKRYRISKNAINTGAFYPYRFLNVNHFDSQESGLKTNVMVGHSATPTCRHIETLEALRPCVGKIRVLCPLSYPDDKNYVSEVSRIGFEIFGPDFVPMTTFMNYEDYLSFLSTVDIGVFNNSRQQGMGNITNLLFLGKKVYLSSDNTISNIYNSKVFNIFLYDGFVGEDFLTPLSEEQKEINRNNVLSYFSDNSFVEKWNKVFN